MTFILDAQRRDPADVVSSFRRYRDYLNGVRAQFPPSAFELAVSEWYFDPSDHRCPHDSWLEEIVISEPAHGKRSEQRSLAARIRLLGAYHDGVIELQYPRVFSYTFSIQDSAGGHRDWRYDQFRLSEAGHVLHEIEWCGRDSTGTWCIEASDVLFEWRPRSAGA